ncbi:dihydroxyacetone kinase subunit DhaL [Romboutsia sp.]|uniref:dihydroxyacetone kinase subunit DhaL n=1 Tax=Romboutsia sp. TaxID=1965302 RepID=UPI003F2D29DB
MKSEQLIQIINKIGEVIEENKLYLTELDATIGDGDHGLNLSKGFKAVKEKLATLNTSSISEVLKTTGMALVSSVGGASGPLYGTAFMKASMVVNNKEEIDINDLEKMLEEALNGVKMRGKSQFGEKTMIDAIEPALNKLKSDISNNLDVITCLENMSNEALKGTEATKNIIATKGRASYLGERSIGHQDAGATSSYLILKTIYEEVKNS